MSTRQGRYYQEVAAVAVAIAAVAAASDASTKADTAAAAIAAVAVVSEAEVKDKEAAIFDFAASIDMDDEDVSSAWMRPLATPTLSSAPASKSATATTKRMV